MNVIVCIKQVPAITDVRSSKETNTLVREGVESIINPFDTYAIEEGVRLRERYGGKVTIITMGPQQAESALREAISLGSDEAVLVSDRAFAGSDTWATSYVLAKAIVKISEYDLIIAGKQTMDGDTGQVGPELAQMLGIPFVAYVSQIEEISDSCLRVQRLIEEGHEIIESPLPCIISVVKEINVPRLPSLRGTMKAKTAPIPVWTAQELDIEADKVGVSGSFTRVVRIFYPQRVCQAEVLEGSVDDQVEQLLEKLSESNVI